MVDIKQSKLDELCEDFEKMSFKAEAWWPTVEEIKTHIEPRLKSCINFALWITETANEPQTDEEKASKKYLMNLLYRNLYIKED